MSILQMRTQAQRGEGAQHPGACGHAPQPTLDPVFPLVWGQLFRQRDIRSAYHFLSGPSDLICKVIEVKFGLSVPAIRLGLRRAFGGQKGPPQ